jgi:outer membrane receptor protein involved in Fe transport
MKFTFSFLFCVFLCSQLLAQIPSDVTPREITNTIKVIGQVVDGIESTGLEFATITIFAKADSTMLGGGLTDVDGKFEVETEIINAFAVIEFIGYNATVIDPLTEEKNIKKNGLINLGTISLNRSSFELDAIEIRAEKSETQFSLDKRVFNVGKDLANRGGSAIDILDNVPSVTVDIEGTVSLRGSEGVRILIDGKRSGLGENLKSIPSNQIDRIEVITNPSARYDAEGMAGIINIILKKDSRKGFNGSFDANGGYPLQSGIGANVNYRKNKINWFAGYGLQYRESPGQGNLFTILDQPNDTTLITNQTRESDRTSFSNTFRFGLDYFFNEKTTLTGSFRYQLSDDANFTTLIYDDYIDDFPKNLSNRTIRTDDEGEDETELEYSLNLRKEFSSREHTLTIAANYDDELESESSIFINTITTGNNQQNVENERSNNDEGQKEWVIQADYIHPFSKDHKMEWGIKSSFRDITNKFRVEEFNEGKWQDLRDAVGNALNNNFIYNEDIYAAYGQYGNKYGKFSYQVGVRIEYANISTRLVETNEINKRENTKLFPSVFLNYEFSETDAFQMSYSRRIQRPRFWYLNPFLTYSDNRNIFSGNPNLDPEYTDSYEMNYLKFWNTATFNAGIFYRHSTGVIERIRSIEGTVTRLSPQNLAERDDFGLEISLTYSGLDWLRLDASGNFFRSITDGSNLGESFYNDSYSWTSRFTSRFTFWKGSDFQIRANYRAPLETTQGKNKSITSIDLGWSKDLLPNKNLTATLSVRDLLNSRKRRYSQFGPNFSTVGEYQWRLRSINLAFNYRINQKKKRERQGRDYDGGEGF